MPFLRMMTYLSRRREQGRLERIYEKYKQYTMIPRSSYISNLRLAQTIVSVPGCVVECGVWRGGMIAGIAEVLGPERQYNLFDSFQGLPPAKEIDGLAALPWQSDTASPIYYDNCMAPREAAAEAMARSPAKAVSIFAGWFND